MPLAKLKITPRYARYYFFFALVLIALPTIMLKILPSHAGRVIVSAGKMNYSVFEKSVIYMTQHHGFGAMGIILNKPLELDSLEYYQKRFPTIRHFHYGGPVGINQGFFLMVPSKESASGFDVLNGSLLMEKDADEFNRIIKDDTIAKDIRLFVGYAGWGAMQLNREIVRGWWDDIPFDPVYLGVENSETVWEKAITRVLEEKKSALEPI